MSFPREPDGPAPPQVELPADWPGLDGAADVYLDHDRVRDILRKLRAELGSLRGEAGAPAIGPGTIGEVQGTSRVGSAHTGTWGTAQYFGQNATQASQVLGGTYQRLVEHIEATITAVEKAVDNYEKGHTRSSA